MPPTNRSRLWKHLPLLRRCNTPSHGRGLQKQLSVFWKSVQKRVSSANDRDSNVVAWVLICRIRQRLCIAGLVGLSKLREQPNMPDDTAKSWSGDQATGQQLEHEIESLERPAFMLLACRTNHTQNVEIDVETLMFFSTFL